MEDKKINMTRSKEDILKEFEDLFKPEDNFGLGEHNLRVKGKYIDVKEFISKVIDKEKEE